jgi:DNA-binding MarR family transcriptional regulator
MVAEAPDDAPTSEAVATNSRRKPYREKLSSEDYLSLARFRSAIRRFLAFSEAETRSAGITTQQYQAMLAIKTHPRGTMMIKELAEELLLLPNSAVQLIDRLEAAGLAQRRESGSDRRSVLVSLTRKGSLLLARLAVDHHAELIANKPLLMESLAHLGDIERAKADEADPA